MAPAVDAHLQRWGEIQRAAPIAARISQHPELIEQAYAADVLASWIVFARSYGLPDKDGNPQAVERVGGVITEVPTIAEGTTIVGRQQMMNSERSTIVGCGLALREAEMLSAATTHYVSAEVINEVTAAAELASPEPLWRTDVFTPAGFAVLETPLIIEDFDPDSGATSDQFHVWIRAIGWHVHPGIARKDEDGSMFTLGDGVTLFTYTTDLDWHDGYEQDLIKGDRDVPEIPFDRTYVLPVEVAPWRFGTVWTTRSDVRHKPGTVPGPVGFQRRWFMAFMRLCFQQIIVRHPHHPKRPEARRWEQLSTRKGKPILDYSVLRLRREVDPSYRPEHTGAPLEYQQKVRGHWKHTYIRSLGPARLPDGTMNPESHRLIWVESYWRGPEDGPVGRLHWATSVTR